MVTNLIQGDIIILCNVCVNYAAVYLHSSLAMQCIPTYVIGLHSSEIRVETFKEKFK